MKEFFYSLWHNPFFHWTVTSLLRLFIAAILGGIIGFEREHSHRPAGFRTHILVAVGSALVMSTSVFMFEIYEGRTNLDPARLGAQVISGIGFLGAGTILREGFSVKGLTTAASLWATSCIGLAVGLGFYEGAFVATIVIYVTLNALKRIIKVGASAKSLYIQVEDVTKVSASLGDIIRKCGGSLAALEILYSDNTVAKFKHTGNLVLKASVYSSTDGTVDLIRDSVLALDGVTDLYID
ncbi:MAG: MgtC/SapB family protein [Clostridiales bacterium]|nr:MgtC/SapB family protein [Clostridiales bacterium]